MPIPKDTCVLIHIFTILIILALYPATANYVMHTTIGSFGASWVTDRFGSDILVTTEFSKIPPPSFPFLFFGTQYTSALLHDHGSIHFGDSYGLKHRRCCNGSCTIPCDLSSTSSKVFEAIFPYNLKTLPNDATFTHKYYSNSTTFIYRTTMTSTSLPTPVSYAVILMAPSVVITVLEPNSETSYLSKSAFIGLIASPYTTLGSSPINTQTTPDPVSLFPDPTVYPPTRLLSFRRDAYAYNSATIYCTLGNSLCMPSYTTPSITNPLSITSNSDAACFRDNQSSLVQFLLPVARGIEKYPSLMCMVNVYTDGTSPPIGTLTTAYYDRIKDVFTCAQPLGIQVGQKISIPYITSASTTSSDSQYQPPGFFTQTNYRTQFTTTSNLFIEDYVPPESQYIVKTPISSGKPVDYKFPVDMPIECECSQLRYRGQAHGNPHSFRPYQYGQMINATATWTSLYNNSITSSFFTKNDFCYRDCSGTLDGDKVFNPCGQCVDPNSIIWGSDGVMNKTAILNCWGMCEDLSMRNTGHFSYLNNLPALARQNGINYPNSPDHGTTAEDISPTPLGDVPIKCASPEFKSSSTDGAFNILSYQTTDKTEHLVEDNGNYTSTFSTLATSEPVPDGFTTRREHLSTTMGRMDGFKIMTAVLAGLGAVFSIYLLIKQKRAEERRRQRRIQRDIEKAKSLRPKPPASAPPASSSPPISPGNEDLSAGEDEPAHDAPPSPPTTTRTSNTRSSRQTGSTRSSRPSRTVGNGTEASGTRQRPVRR